MTDDLRVIIAFRAVISLGNQGGLSLYISAKTEKSPYWISLLSKHTQQRDIYVDYSTGFSVVGASCQQHYVTKGINSRGRPH